MLFIFLVEMFLALKEDFLQIPITLKIFIYLIFSYFKDQPSADWWTRYNSVQGQGGVPEIYFVVCDSLQGRVLRVDYPLRRINLEYVHFNRLRSQI